MKLFSKSIIMRQNFCYVCITFDNFQSHFELAFYEFMSFMVLVSVCSGTRDYFRLDTVHKQSEKIGPWTSSRIVNHLRVICNTLFYYKCGPVKKKYILVSKVLPHIISSSKDALKNKP